MKQTSTSKSQTPLKQLHVTMSVCTWFRAMFRRGISQHRDLKDQCTHLVVL